MTEKWIAVGIDLALRSRHTAVARIAGVEESRHLPSFHTNPRELRGLVQKARELAGPDTRTEFVMEPTCSAWVPVARWLTRQGFTVYLVRPEKVADLRRYLRKHTKTDTIDADTLARLRQIDGDTLFVARLQSKAEYACWRLCKQRARSARQLSSIKTRIGDFVQLAVPGLVEVLEDSFGGMGRALLRKHLNPIETAQLPWSRFLKICQQAHSRPVDVEKVRKMFQAFLDAGQLWRESQGVANLEVDFDELQEEVRRELELLEVHERAIEQLDANIAALYQKIDPHKVLTSIQGIGPTIGAAITSRVGDIRDFPNLKAFRSYCGFVPRKKQTSKNDRQGLRITKAANSLLKDYLYMAAETARHWDAEFADFYVRLTLNGKKHHNKALVALGNKMAGRIYAVLKRAALGKQSPEYQLLDLHGKVISKAEARKLVLEVTGTKKTTEERSTGTAT